MLTGAEVRAVLGAVRHPVRRMALLTIYALGLRLGEGLRLTTEHIDAARLTVWVRDGKGARDRERLLRYLGRYVHRTAMGDKAMTSCTHAAVTFRYRDSRSGERKRMTLPPHELLRRFLQHVPPRGMHRVRAFGLLHPSHRATLRRLQLMLDAPPQDPDDNDTADTDTRHDSPPPPRALLRCPHCEKHAAHLTRRLTADQCRQWLCRNAARAPPPAADAVP